jgi:hypothetical protein
VSVAAKKAGVPKKARVRYGPLPKLDATVEIPYANTRADAPSSAQVVRAMLESDAWRDVMKPMLDLLQAERDARKKVAPAYTCEELESVFLYQAIAGIDTVHELRTHLTSHLGAEARQLLGFKKPRKTKGQVTTLQAVPSEATLSRYRLSFAPADAGRVERATKTKVEAGIGPTLYDFKRAEVERKRAATRVRRDLYLRFFARWIEEYAKTDEGREASQLLFADGTTMLSYFNCLITDEGVPQNDEPRPRERCRVQPVFTESGSKGQRVWDGRLSEAQWEALKHQDPTFRRYWKFSADGGYLALAAGEARFGHGYNVVDIVDSVGMPLAFGVGPNQMDERKNLLPTLGRLGESLGHFPSDPDKVRVFGADAGFTGFDVYDAVRDLGMLENIHPVSGSREARSIQHAARRRSKRFRIVHKDTGRETWLTDGHRNLFCECGKGEVQKKFHRTKNGRLIPRLEGQCDKCGPITITSGDWKLIGSKWKHRTKNPGGTIDLPMGNPLTFTNPISESYAGRRFAVQEGAHSILANRFGLIRGRRRVKYSEDVELRVAMTFCAIHGIAYTRALLAKAPPAQAPPLAA